MTTMRNIWECKTNYNHTIRLIRFNEFPYQYLAEHIFALATIGFIAYAATVSTNWKPINWLNASWILYIVTKKIKIHSPPQREVDLYNLRTCWHVQSSCLQIEYLSGKIDMDDHSHPFGWSEDHRIRPCMAMQRSVWAAHCTFSVEIGLQSFGFLLCIIIYLHASFLFFDLLGMPDGRT